MSTRASWNDLTYDEQTVYLTRAEYLISNGHVSGVDELALAKEMYRREVKKM